MSESSTSLCFLSTFRNALSRVLKCCLPGRPGALSCCAQSRQAVSALRVSIADATPATGLRRCVHWPRNGAAEVVTPFRRAGGVHAHFILVRLFCSGGSPRRAGRSTVIRSPARVRFAVPHPFALAIKTARLRCGLR